MLQYQRVVTPHLRRGYERLIPAVRRDLPLRQIRGYLSYPESQADDLQLEGLWAKGLASIAEMVDIESATSRLLGKMINRIRTEDEEEREVYVGMALKQKTTDFATR